VRAANLVVWPRHKTREGVSQHHSNKWLKGRKVRRLEG
jgi:hypothetical protein